MAKTMTPSGITPKQIGKTNELIGAALRKSDIQSEPFQQILEHHGKELVTEFIAMVRTRIEAVSNMVVRRVRVNRVRIPEEALAATGRRQYVNDSVVANMPRGEGKDVDVHFFKPRQSAYRNGVISPDDLQKEYDFQGLTPVDPFALAAVNEADPAFADMHPNGSQWKNSNGEWCYIAFSRWYDDRKVNVDQSDDDWNAYWWFAGVRK